MECKLANIVNGQKRLATYLTAKAGVHECVFAPSFLNQSNLQRRCQLTQNEEFFLSAFDSRLKLEKSDTRLCHRLPAH